jgi:protocatechuate 3,4-dioxygenase beta subunit
MENNDVRRESLHELTEGPYYKKGSPKRTHIIESGTTGEKLIVEGRMRDCTGSPIAGGWLDFWQADGKGEYDNVGYNLRGHQYTDKSGSYRLETVVPAMYGSRTRHIHVKARANPQSPVVTTQIFFPGESKNKIDPLFDQSLVVDISSDTEGLRARFDFILDVD